MDNSSIASPVRSQPHRRGLRRASVGTGATSLLMIFTVLCFATLAMLSLSTADNNQKIQQRNTQNSIELAAAKGQAAAALAELDGQLLALGAGWEALDAARAAEGLGWAHTGTAPDGDSALQLELVLPVNETTELVTQIEVLPPGSPARYRLTGQSTRLSAGWEPEGGPGVWEGIQ